MSQLSKIMEIEAEMARTQKNKATAKHLGLLKAKLSKLKSEMLANQSKGGGGGGEGFDVKATGDTRIGFVGFPSVGKSTLMSKLTGTFSEVAAYEFTTLTCVPGQMRYKGAKFQLLDLPGIIEGALDGKGRGRQIISTAKSCSMLLIVLDAMKPARHKLLVEKECEGFGIRLNKTPPDIGIKKKQKGGLSITKRVELTHLDDETIASICREYKLGSAEVSFREDATDQDLIDAIEGNRIYMPCIYVLNKIDAITIEELDILSQIPHHVPVSAKDEWNFDDLLEKMWQYCKMLRIYTKPRGQIPDYGEPVILHAEAPTIEEFCNRIHRNIMKQFKYAWVWGKSCKHQPQKCGKAHVLMDEDIVQIVKK